MDMIPRIFSYAIESCNTAAVGIYMNSHWLWFHLTLSEYITRTHSSARHNNIVIVLVVLIFSNKYIAIFHYNNTIYCNTPL